MTTFNKRMQLLNKLSETDSKALLLVIYSRLELDNPVFKNDLTSHKLKEDLIALLDLLDET